MRAVRHWVSCILSVRTLVDGRTICPSSAQELVLLAVWTVLQPVCDDLECQGLPTRMQGKRMQLRQGPFSATLQKNSKIGKKRDLDLRDDAEKRKFKEKSGGRCG